MIFNRLPATLVVAMCTMLFVTTISTEVAAQRGGRGGPGGGIGGMLGDSSIALLGDSKVAEELELDEEQVEALDELQGDMRNVFRETFSGMRERFRQPDVDREALMEEISEAIKEKMTVVDEKLEEVLLPHQMSRLSELTFQRQAKRGGTQGLLENSRIKEELGITDKQIEKVKAKAEEVKKKLEKQILKAREDAQNEILSVLTSDQQAKIKKMLGESFAFDENRGRGGRDGGGRGGRDGGGRGGRDGGPRGDRDGGPRGDRDGGPRGDRDGGPRGDRDGGPRGDRDGGDRRRGKRGGDDGGF